MEIGIFETGARMDRRQVVKRMGAGALVAAAAGIGLVKRASAQDEAALASGSTGCWQTTAALNLRSKPSTSGSVILVIPQGHGVRFAGDASGGYQNGYIRVSYKGTVGWAHGSYLQVTNCGSSDQGPQIVGEGTTTTAVNLRSGPSTGHQVLRVLAKGTTIQVSDAYSGGFRYVVHNGLAGWIYADYIAVGGGPVHQYKTTTTALNLREQPSTSAKVLAVMPKGSAVAVGDQRSNGFRSVTYGSLSGWAYEQYLA